MISEDLLGVLRSAIRAEVKGRDRVTVAYSGGIDSSIVACLAREESSVECITCAVDGSFDARNAEKRAAEEGLHTTLVMLKPEDLEDRVAMASDALETVDPLQIAYTIPLISVVLGSKEEFVLAGNGADELFGGYSKYLSSDDPSAAMAKDLRKMLREVAQLERWAGGAGKGLSFPFTSRDVLSFSELLPITDKLYRGQRKVILKGVARLLDLPSGERPKKAAQYSSGVLRLMERSAKRDGRSLSEWTMEVAKRSGRSSYESA